MKVIWSLSAKNDLKFLHDWFLETSKSREIAQRFRLKIIKKCKAILFLKQYQSDEILGEPYRRIMVNNYRIVYKISSNNDVLILKIFDNRQNPKKLSL
ncbi:MAG: type II toxin-antitoxin system RelE/ParE family toxin [Spirosomataceae bacterium]|jgi:plasmid stabilization system protein ParE